MADENCAHTGCSCKVDPGKGASKGGKSYCNDNCANAETSGSSRVSMRPPRLPLALTGGDGGETTIPLWARDGD